MPEYSWPPMDERQRHRETDQAPRRPRKIHGPGEVFVRPEARRNALRRIAHLALCPREHRQHRYQRSGTHARRHRRAPDDRSRQRSAMGRQEIATVAAETEESPTTHCVRSKFSMKSCHTWSARTISPKPATVPSRRRTGHAAIRIKPSRKPTRSSKGPTASR